MFSKSPISKTCRFLRSRAGGMVFFKFLLLVLLAGCGKSNESEPLPEAPPLEVGYDTVVSESVTLGRELPGRISAHRIAEVRARVDGIVQKRHFTEGAEVKEGELLFSIDPAPYEVELENAKANLARAEANFTASNSQAERFSSLVSTNAVSKQAYENALSDSLAFKADIAAGRAAVRGAEINLGYTRVVSPISGRIGRAMVTEGAYVQKNTATLLAIVQQLDPLYVDLSQSAEEMFQLKEALSSGRLRNSGKDAAEITILLGDGRTYAHTGTLQFSDVSVNTTTGTVTLRGTVPNPGLDLLPGMFVRAGIVEGTDPAAILIAQQLVSRNAQGDATVYVVGEDDTIELRVLTVPRTVGNRWLVTSGLAPGDRVVVDNRQKIRPGQKVIPVPVTDSKTAEL